MYFILQVREAAQGLLLAELERIGPKGRKTLVEFWVQYLPVSNSISGMQSAAASYNNLTNLTANVSFTLIALISLHKMVY